VLADFGLAAIQDAPAGSDTPLAFADEAKKKSSDALTAPGFEIGSDDIAVPATDGDANVAAPAVYEGGGLNWDSFTLADLEMPAATAVPDAAGERAAPAAEPAAPAVSDAFELLPFDFTPSFTEPPTVVPAPAAPIADPAAGAGAPPEAATLATLPDGVEPELLEVFLEEAQDVLATLGGAAEACQTRPDDHETLPVIRRAFHTLKGSGRMVGLNELGETAWRLEQLMNGWLAESKAATGDLLQLVGRARGVLQQWVDALQAGRAETLPVPALLAAVDRVAQGQPFDAPAVSVPAMASAPAAAPESRGRLLRPCRRPCGAPTPH
jgi:chemosensory pili system protein ChpA (sensor histidine kinase/response regulator)